MTRTDRFTPVYVLPALAACLLWDGRFAINAQYPVASLFMVLLPLLVIGSFLFFALIVSLILAQWRRATSVLLTGALALVILVSLPINIADWLIFELNWTHYDPALTDLPGVPGSRIKAWLFRDQGGFGGGAVETYIVYDESAEIVLPSAQWSEPWRNRAFFAGLPDRNFQYLVSLKSAEVPYGFRVTHIRGSWYFVDLAF